MYNIFKKQKGISNLLSYGWAGPSIPKCECPQWGHVSVGKGHGDDGTRRRGRGAGHASVGGGMGHASAGRGKGHAGAGRGTERAGAGGERERAQAGKGRLLPRECHWGGHVGKDQELGTPTHGPGHAIPPRAWESPGTVTLYYRSWAHCAQRPSRDRAGNVGRSARPLSPV